MKTVIKPNNFNILAVDMMYPVLHNCSKSKLTLVLYFAGLKHPLNRVLICFCVEFSPTATVYIIVSL